MKIQIDNDCLYSLSIKGPLLNLDVVVRGEVIKKFLLEILERS